jgi:hypothetical protein
MQKLIYGVIFLVLSSMTYAVEIDCKVNEVVGVPVIFNFSYPLSFEVVDSGKIDPNFTECRVFGYADVEGETITFQKKSLLCTDGDASRSFELTGIEVITGEFVINGTKAKYDKAMEELAIHMLCGDYGVNCKEQHPEMEFSNFQSMKMTLDILSPRVVISPYETFKMNFTVE